MKIETKYDIGDKIQPINIVAEVTAIKIFPNGEDTDVLYELTYNASNKGMNFRSFDVLESLIDDELVGKIIE